MSRNGVVLNVTSRPRHNDDLMSRNADVLNVASRPRHNDDLMSRNCVVLNVTSRPRYNGDLMSRNGVVLNVTSRPRHNGDLMSRNAVVLNAASRPRHNDDLMSRNGVVLNVTSRPRHNGDLMSRNAVVLNAASRPRHNDDLMSRNGVVLNVTNAEDYVEAKDTYHVESFNNSILIYLDKRVHYLDDTYNLRQSLAVLDWNEHVGRHHTSTYFIEDSRHPDRQGGKKNYTKKTYSFVQDIRRLVLDTAAVNETSQVTNQSISEDDSTAVPGHVTEAEVPEPPSKADSSPPPHSSGAFGTLSSAVPAAA
ncbi:uncharacterized protein ISCGN_031068 [Ixodes scapularis]